MGARRLWRGIMPQPRMISETLVPGSDGWRRSLPLPYDSPVRQALSPPAPFEHGETEAQTVKLLPKGACW